MANKYLALVVGKIKQIEALVTSAGAGDSGKIPALDSSGKLDTSMMPVGIGADTKSIVSSENLTAGDFVNTYDNGGTLNVRKADASSNAKEAHGFVLANVTSPAAATVYFEGTNTALTGLTRGVKYWLSGSTPGGAVVAASIPTAAGHIVQELGPSLSATEISFEPQATVELA